ncbi:MAG: M24 family metallopeptidase [Egibacteraceae bacterium]
MTGGQDRYPRFSDAEFARRRERVAGEPVLFVQNFNHVPNAAAVASLEDVRWGGNDSGATVGGEIARRQLRPVGVVGLMPYQHHASMVAATGGAVEFQDVAAAIRPGATQEEVLDAAEPIEKRGLSIRDALVHGFGIGILPPSIRTRHTSHGQAPWTFEANQTIVIQPNVITPDERLGVQVGDLCVVRPDGAESLHRFPVKLVRTGS